MFIIYRKICGRIINILEEKRLSIVHILFYIGIDYKIDEIRKRNRYYYIGKDIRLIW